MKFQPRDSEMLQAIYENQGVLAKRQLKTLFWEDKSSRAMEQRLAKLYDAGYLSWPTKDQYRAYPIPEAICWLGWRGALYVAGSLGIDVPPPNGDNEYQLRILETRLRKLGFTWLREPRWSLLEHDLAIIDFKMAVETAVKNSPSLTLAKWVSEKEFRSYGDTVLAEVTTMKGQDIRIHKKVYPDAYFEIVNEKLQAKDEPSKARFLVEFDMSTHDTQRFGRDKVNPGLEYIKSTIYKSRFGANNGYWLVIAKGGSRRIQNLILQVEKNAGSDGGLFFFTSLEELQITNPLTSPVWQQVGGSKPRPLLIT
jgi:hypothetical protein